MIISERPSYHFVAPRGWINDPCAPGYDPRTGLYHLFYQWNPHSHAWDNISWGHATSKDLINWEHASDPVFVPDQPYDRKGVFTGCYYPTGVNGEDDELSVFYTSVSHLPITWSEPYERGCEGLALATSKDEGKSWQKSALNPILAEEPEGIHVTGFRDPFLAPWPEMDTARNSPPTLYGLVSGGIHDLGPRTFLYTVDPKDLAKWTYVHPLMDDRPINFVPSAKWAGDFGVNWECTNFRTLQNGDHTRQLVFTGAEGGKERPWVEEYHKKHPRASRRTPRYPNWMFGRLQGRETEVRMSIETAGLLDWGLFYAASSFTAADGRVLLWGWLIEEDLSDDLLKAKGWTGCLGVPRELFLSTTSDVLGALSSSLESIASVETTREESGKHTVHTLGIRPIVELRTSRQTQVYQHLAGSTKSKTQYLCQTPPSCEISATIHVFSSTTQVSLILRHDQDLATRTSITFSPQDETLSVEREHSTSCDEVNTCPEVGSHTLFRTRAAGSTEETLEPLRLTVYLDHDVIEVFANDRFALATRVYSPGDCQGLSLECQGGGWVESLDVWELHSVDSQ